MTLEVGMYYTRTNDGKLGLCKCGNMTPKEYVERYKDIYNVKNASHNIIDLIEVGDYVNGYLVLFAGATTWDNDGNVLDKQVHINHNGYDLWLREEYIKSIVTKEQFESMSYKVGE